MGPAATLADRARVDRDRVIGDVTAVLDRATTEKRELRPAELAAVDALTETAAKHEQRREMFAAMADSRNSRISVRREPLTYSPEGKHSYFGDLVRDKLEPTPQGTERLARHAAEMRIEVPKLAERQRRDHPDAELEYRTNPSRTPGQGGYFSPPLWIIELLATAPRPQRVLAGLATTFTLPRNVSSVNLPRLTTGTAVGVAVDGGPGVSQDFVDAGCSSEAVMLAGHSDVSLQLLEQSPPGASLDFAVGLDLAAAYDAQLETQLTVGTGGAGSGAQLSGLLNLVPSANNIAYTDASPTATELYPSLGLAFAAVSNTRKIRPEVWIMRGGRFAWLSASEDNSLRPLETPMAAQAYIRNPATPTPIGGLLGLPIFTSEAIPVTLPGVTGTQDTIIGCRPSDLLLWESTPTVEVFTEAPLAGTLGARIRLRGTAAAIFGRYPSGISQISGTGMVVPAGY
jgi:Phage capsid family